MLFKGWVFFLYTLIFGTDDDNSVIFEPKVEIKYIVGYGALETQLAFFFAVVIV